MAKHVINDAEITGYFNGIIHKTVGVFQYFQLV